MKQLPLISSMLYCQPWCVLGDVHAELGRLYDSYLKGTLGAGPEMLHGAAQVSSGIGFQVDSETGLALVSVEGVILKRCPDILCGPQIADLAKLDAILEDATHDPNIRTVVIYLRTPGGCGIGLMETSSYIEDLIAAGKRVVAFSDFQCCSAGYWIMASCQEAYVAPSSSVGSISTYVAALDDSRAWEMQGLKLKLFKDGDLKAMGHAGKPWTKEEEDYLEGRKNAWGKTFKDHVRRSRPGARDEDMQGQSFDGADAPAWMVDGLCRDLNSFLVIELERLAV